MVVKMYCVWLLLVFSVFNVVSEELYELNIIHYNDFHARFVETSPAGTICNPNVAPCIGGFARLATLIRQALDKKPDSLVLNGGDSFQGTIWYNLLRWNVTQDFMNMVPHDAHVLGNHEFDNGIEGIVPYLQHLKSPVVTANIIDDDEPTIQGLYKPSIIVEKRNRKIGIIGVLIASTDTLASTGDLKFTDEVEAVKREAEKLHEQGINIIIVLSHCGLDIDKLIALNAGPYIDIIVGGHSHTLLSNTNPPEDSPFNPQGPYPYVVEQPTRSVLIVQVGAHTAFLGEIKLFFNDDGDLINWAGDPHYISNDVVQAPDVLQKINEYLPLINEQATELIGMSKVDLSSQCSCGECNLGSLVCDAFLHETLVKSGNNKWNEAHFCVINTGGVRSTIEAGNVTFEKILLSTPFENNVEMFDLRGDHIMEMLEYAVANDPYPGGRMVQVSGLRAVFDGARPRNSRVVTVTVRCNDCDIPRYDPLDPNKIYKVVSQTFIGGGGDGFSVLGNHEFDNGIDGVVPYLQHLKSPVVTANIIDDDEPKIQGLYKPSIIVEKGGRRIGIIGVITAITDQLAITEGLKFTDEVEAVKREAEKLHEQGINIIIVLSHSGFDIDRQIALHAGSHIDIIVGGHSHTLLSNTKPPEDSPFIPQGPYPFIVEHPERSVLIVQVGAHTAFLGEIKLFFNDDGDLINWAGDPHYISNDVVQAPDVLQKINEYLPLINEQATELIGISKIRLSSQCNCGECNLGSFICDAYMHETVVKSGNNKWNEAHFCVVITGDVRSDIEAGNVTFESILRSTPFENNIEMYDLRGEHIMEILEYAVANDPWAGARMIQVSGLRAVFDGMHPINNRVVTATVRCNDCDIPRYEPLDPNKIYKVVSQSYIGGGGDGFTMISNNRKNVEVLGVDYDVIMSYVRHRSPIVQDLDGRIQIFNPCIQN